VLVRSFYLSNESELEQSLRHHEEVTLAAAEFDGETAKNAMELHLRISFRRFIRRRSEYQKHALRDEADG
jgi:DNA-binding GntR family transcriptional regulator